MPFLKCLLETALANPLYVWLDGSKPIFSIYTEMRKVIWAQEKNAIGKVIEYWSAVKTAQAILKRKTNITETSNKNI
jgi:hypothetical protein